MLKDKGLGDLLLKDKELQSHKHKQLGDKLFKDEELLPFEDKDGQ